MQHGERGSKMLVHGREGRVNAEDKKNKCQNVINSTNLIVYQTEPKANNSTTSMDLKK